MFACGGGLYKVVVLADRAKRGAAVKALAISLCRVYYITYVFKCPFDKAAAYGVILNNALLNIILILTLGRQIVYNQSKIIDARYVN